ncbi:MAG: TIM barrel protein, partial [Bacteroidota bacterium]
MNLYISTMAFLGMTIEEIVKRGTKFQYPIEFSSALPYSQDLVEHFLDYPHSKLAHNYFPAPEVPFVLNLASREESIRQKSIQHCLKGLELSAKANAPFYAAHAGFCIDPKPEELGRKLKQSTQQIDREKHWRLFKKSVDEILKIADQWQVEFYIENNVTARMNLNSHGQNPLLCSSPEELDRLANMMDHPRFGLLLDTAHLKVSAQTLGF